MRDLLVTVVFIYLIYATIKKPFIGLGLWLWSSSFNLNRMVYGFAISIPFNKIIAICTIISFFISKEKSKLKFDKLTLLIISFFILATLSNVFAIGNSEQAWMRWEYFYKIILFYLFAIMILDKKIHFDFLVWLLVVSIGGLAGAEGLKFIASGGSYRIAVIPAISGDNNFFGVMIGTILPFTYYLKTQVKQKALNTALIVLMLLMSLGIVATYSRGALIGLIIFGGSFFVKSKNKLLIIVIIAVIGYAAAMLLPEQWFTRMNTIENADEDDSFMGRVIAWKISILIGMDNFLGGGFRAIENYGIWLKYAAQFYKLDFIPSPMPSLVKFKAAHSIYFEVLGNHGFIGLFLFVSMLLTAYFKAARIQRIAKINNYESWMIDLTKMIQISLTVFSTTGALVNVAYFDFLYAIFAMIVALDYKVQKMVINDMKAKRMARQKLRDVRYFRD